MAEGIGEMGNAAPVVRLRRIVDRRARSDSSGDGRIDIAVAGKSGTYILFNLGR